MNNNLKTTTTTTTRNNSNNNVEFIKRITTSNFEKEIVVFKSDLENASFISIDTEFSGLGYNKGLKSQDIQERYHSMISVVKSRSLLEFGVSIFTETKPPSSNNINDISNSSTTQPPPPPNIENIVQSNENTVDNLPLQQTTELDQQPQHNNYKNDDNNIVYDSNNSLEVLYTVKIYNFLMLNQSDFQVSPNSMSFLAEHGFDFNQLFFEGIKFHSKKDHGFCKLGEQCPNSHDIDLILDQEESIKNKSKRKKRSTENNNNNINNIDLDSKNLDDENEDGELNVELQHISKKQKIEDIISTSTTTDVNINIEVITEINENENNILEESKKTSLSSNKDNIHSAGFDSAMTGFIFAHYLQIFPNPNTQKELSNKIYLSGKNHPLVLMKSNYSIPTSSSNMKSKPHK
eukprot:gene7431-9133_t